MKKAFQDMWKWWKGLKWYWKIFGCLLLVIVAGLWLLSLLDRRDAADLVEIDDFHEKKTDRRLDELEEQRKEVDRRIAATKKEIATKLNQANSIDAETLKRREALTEAKSMEELDELQKEWDL